MNKIERLQYITNDDFGLLDQLALLASAGAKWVQLRIKERERAELELPKLVEKSKSWGFTVIVNDYVDLALELDADGVHLGKKDTGIDLARKILGPDKIIGVTINSPEDLSQVVHKSINYIGLGPLRYTSTKSNLEPLLGYDGVGRICKQASMLCPSIPVIVVGGVIASDVSTIKDLGAFGVAVSSGITRAPVPEEEVAKFLMLLEGINNEREIAAR